MTAVHLSQAAADAVFLGDRLRRWPTRSASPAAQAHHAARTCGSPSYNLIAVPVAIAGLATPLVAASPMSGSSVLVTASALRASVARARE